MQFQCAKCGTTHDAANLEPSFSAPDAYYEVPEAERAQRTYLTQDTCGVRDLADVDRRYFLRAVMPVPVRGESRPCHWGVWVEVSLGTKKRVDELWDDPDQSLEPALPAHLGNEIREYPRSLGLEGTLQLSGPKTRPQFVVAPTDHTLVNAQTTGVWPEIVIEWVMARHA
jgi:hypothetical protein